MFKLNIVLFLVFCFSCFAFDIDDIQYDRMPPLFSLDNYHRCLLHNGTYCVVKVEFLAGPDNDLMKLLQNYTRSSHIKHYNHTYQEKGVCVTSTCREFLAHRTLDAPRDLQEILNQCSNKSIFEEYGLEARVSDVFYCDKAKDVKERPNLADWTVIAGILAIIMINVAATLYDWRLGKQSKESVTKGEELLLCFSMKKNWKYLFSNIPVMGGISSIRVFASFGMVLGHVVWIFTMGFIDNPQDFERSYRLPHIQVIFNGMIVVQFFFVISGFLVIYNVEKYFDKTRKPTCKNIAVIFILRIVRLLPSLSVMLALTATWLRFAGSGPLWNRHVTPVVNDCRKYWWTHLLFINNYVKENKFCAIQTWHIATDIQVFFVAVSLYLLTSYRQRMRLMTGLLLLSFVFPALHVYFQDLEAMLIKSPEFLRTLDNPNFGGAYVLGHNNISCFVLGMMAAFKMHQWQKNGVIFKAKIFRYLFRLCVPLTLALFFAGTMFHEEDGRTPLWARVLFQSVHRFICGLPIAYLIIGLGMDVDRTWRRFMEWRGFAVLGRLTYAVYLLHMNFVPVIAGSKTQLEHFSYLDLMIYQMGIVTLSYLISIPLFLMVEAPTTPVVKILLRKSKTKVHKKDLETINGLHTGISKEKMKHLLEDITRASSHSKKAL